MVFQRFPEPPPVAGGNTALRHHHQVEAAERLAVVPETLPDQPLDQVARDRGLQLFPGYGEPEAGMRQLVFRGQDEELRIRRPDPAAEDLTVGRGAAQAVLFRQSPRAGGHASGRQSLATLGPSRFQDQTPGPGPHPEAETVASLALQFAGLVCTFHDLELVE